MSAARRTNTTASYGAVFVVLAALGLVGGVWFGLPGSVAAFVLVMAYGWTEPFPQLTGPKSASSRSLTAADGAELSKVEAWQAARQMRHTPLPGRSWLPGRPVQMSWLGAVWTGGVVALLPVTQPEYRAVGAVAAFAVVAGFCAGRRRGLNSPGTTLDVVAATYRHSPATAIAVTSAGGIVGLAASWGATILLDLTPLGLQVPATVFWAVGAVGGGGAGATLVSRRAALAAWLRLREVRGEWMGHWRLLKQDPAPACLSTRLFGGVEATVFDAKGGRSAVELIGMAGRIATLVGAGRMVCVLPTPNETGQGPVPGTMHPTKVELVVWPEEGWPDVGDPQIDPDLLELTVRVALTAGPAGAGQGPVLPVLIEPLHLSPALEAEETDDASDDEAGQAPAEGVGRAVWAVDLAWPMGPGPTAVRIGGYGANGLTAGLLGDALLDHRANNGAGTLYIGDLDHADLPEPAANGLRIVREEDRWNQAWSSALKTTVNPPVLQHQQTAEAALANGTTVQRWVFAARNGLDPMENATPGTEKKLATAAAPISFITISGWTQGVGSRPGTRHPQAFTVYAASGRIPARPDDLAPVRGNANQWVLTGHVNHAFDAIRQPRPEIVAATCLTTPDSRGHLWEIKLRLYGPVSFGDVRTYAERLRQAMAAAWLRVADTEDGCTLIVGADPKRVMLASPGRDSKRIIKLDWDQAWVDAKVLGSGNRVPHLSHTDVLPSNERVQVLDFDLVAGLDLATIRAAIPKLRTNTGNEYLQIRPGPGGAGTIRVLCCETDPMPTLAPFDHEAAQRSGRGRWPFGTAVDGTAMTWNVTDGSHLLVAGMSGAGKSVTVQTLLAAMAVKPAAESEFYVIDVQKMGADYRFMADYLSSEAYESGEAAALIRAVYAKGVERIRRNAALGVGNVTEWPEGPPPQMVLVIDEFTSLITTEQVSRTPFDDPELEATRRATVQDNQNRTVIGQYTGKIARELRAAGVTLILATQQLKQDSLKAIPGGDTLKSSLARMLLGKASFGELSAALKNPVEAADLGEVVPRGRGLFESSSHYAAAFQAWFEPDTAKLTAAIAAARPPVAERIDVTPWLPAPVDQGPAIVPVRLDDFAPKTADVVIDLGTLELDLDDLNQADPEEPEADDESTAAAGASDGDGAGVDGPWEQWEADLAVTEDPAVTVPSEDVWGNLGDLWDRSRTAPRSPARAHVKPAHEPQPLGDEFPDPPSPNQTHRPAPDSPAQPDGRWASDQF